MVRCRFQLRFLLWNVLFIALSQFSCVEKRDTGSEKAVEYKSLPTGPKAIKVREQIPSKVPSVVIRDTTIMTATGKVLKDFDLFLSEGRIKNIGRNLTIKADVEVNGQGKFVSPGLIDTHSHLGVYSMPGVQAHSDGNESVKAQTAEVWAEHSFWPQDPGLWRALSSGVTTIHVLPGSANLIGGRSVTLRTDPKISVEEMKFPGAPQGLKMACGENPKRIYGERGGPSTRMGNFAGYRNYFQKAFEYGRAWDIYEKDLQAWKKKNSELGASEDPPTPPSKNHSFESLVGAMNGEILVQVHCYRADEMNLILDLAKDFGFKVRSFHHALEAYKIAERLAKSDVSVSTWADWWGFKMEAFDGIPQNIALNFYQGVKAIVHSDSEEDIRFLNIEAAKAMTAGKNLGIQITDDEAMQWVTINPAWALGIQDQTGSIEIGKLADIVLWDGHPFSAYSKATQVYIEGELVFDRLKGQVPESDFEIGIRNEKLGDLLGKSINTRKDIPIFELKESISISQEDNSKFVLSNATILLSSGGLAKRYLLISDGKIKAVSKSLNPKWTTFRQLDLKGSYLTPGFFEAQSKLGVVLVGMEKQGKDVNSGTGMMPGFRVVDGFDPFSIRIPIARSKGVTSAVITPSGDMIAGQGFVANLDSSDLPSGPVKSIMFAEVKGPNVNRSQFWMKLREAISDAERYMAYKKGQKKLLNYNLSLSPHHLSEVYKVMKGEIPLVLQAHRLSDILGAIRFKNELLAKGYPIKLLLSGAEESWLAKADLAKAKIPVIITPTRQLPSSLDRLRVRDDIAKVLSDAGVEIVISSSDDKVGRLRQQAGWAVSYGLSYVSAMKAITETPARVFGFKNRGKIAVEHRADLVAWNGDPLDPRSTVQSVWIEGKMQNLSTRQSKLASKYYKPKKQ